MEMLLDRIFLGYDGKSSGLQAILEPLGWTQHLAKNFPVISHFSRVFLFFFVLRLFTKFRGFTHLLKYLKNFGDVKRPPFLETTFDGQKIPDFLEFFKAACACGWVDANKLRNNLPEPWMPKKKGGGWVGDF